MLTDRQKQTDEMAVASKICTSNEIDTSCELSNNNIQETHLSLTNRATRLGQGRQTRYNSIC